MLITEIMKFPTSIVTPPGGAHESLLRSYQTLEKVKELLEKRVPHDVILELIETIQNAPSKECGMSE